MQAYGGLPLSFEPNEGQAGPGALFLARGPGYSLSLAPDAAVIALASPADPADGQAAAPTVVRMQLVGSNVDAALSGLDSQAGTTSYLVGSDPSRWRTSIPHFGRVLSQGVYPGVDMICDGAGGRLEYDFAVAPGTDPGVIRLAFAGVGSMSVAPDGSLILPTAAGDLRQEAPAAYQEIDGSRRPVTSAFRLSPDGQVGFSIGAYDPSYPLVIDPVLDYSTYLGGPYGNIAGAIATDPEGDAYISGLAIGNGYPYIGPSGMQSGFSTVGLFVVKLNAEGSEQLYTTYIGSGGNGEARGIAVDAAGDAYVTGDAGSDGFPIVNGPQPPLHGGGVFVVKLDPSGSSALYSRFLDTQHGGKATGIAIDAIGNAYVTGSMTGGDLDVANPFQATQDGEKDAFVSKLDPSGSLVYSTYLGGSGQDEGLGIAVDGAGSAYVTGTTTSADFPTVNPFQSTLNGGQDAFVAKLNPTGSALVYSTYLGGSGVEEDGDGINDAGGITVDASGSAYVTGSTQSPDFPTRHAFQAALGGTEDAFVSKLDPSGATLAYSSFLGGSGKDVGWAIALDAAGHAFVTGDVGSSDFPTVDPVQASLGSGPNTKANAFVTEVASSGSALLFSTYLGGSFLDGGRGIAVDPAGNVLVTGQAVSKDFPTVHPLQTFTGQYGVAGLFVAKISGFAPLASSTSLTVTPSPSGSSRFFLLEARVSATGSEIVPVGSVTFLDGNVPLAVVPLDAGSASLPVALAPGSHSISVVYGGSSDLGQSDSTVAMLVIPPIVPAVATTASSRQFPPATRLPGLPGHPHGNGGRGDRIASYWLRWLSSMETPCWGSSPLDAFGHAIIETPRLAAGVHTISVRYAGDSTHAASTATMALTVSPLATVSSLLRFGIHAGPTTLVIGFSVSLDPATASDIRNYRVIAANGRAIRVKSATYDPVTQAVTLRFEHPLPLRTRYVLTVRGTGPTSLKDSGGRPLDGDLNGISGGDFSASLDRSSLAGASLRRPAGSLPDRRLSPRLKPPASRPNSPDQASPQRGHASRR